MFFGKKKLKEIGKKFDDQYSKDQILNKSKKRRVSNEIGSVRKKRKLGSKQY